jgi:hypothetical protein
MCLPTCRCYPSGGGVRGKLARLVLGSVLPPSGELFLRERGTWAKSDSETTCITFAFNRHGVLDRPTYCILGSSGWQASEVITEPYSPTQAKWLLPLAPSGGEPTPSRR